MARPRSATEPCCAHREINHADVPSRAIADAMHAAPSSVESSKPRVAGARAALCRRSSPAEPRMRLSSQGRGGLERDDAIDDGEHGRPVRDDEHAAAASGVCEGVDHSLLGVRVEMRRRLVEEHEWRVT